MIFFPLGEWGMYMYVLFNTDWQNSNGYQVKNSLKLPVRDQATPRDKAEAQLSTKKQPGPCQQQGLSGDQGLVGPQGALPVQGLADRPCRPTTPPGAGGQGHQGSPSPRHRAPPWGQGQAKARPGYGPVGGCLDKQQMVMSLSPGTYVVLLLVQCHRYVRHFKGKE